MTFFSQLSVNTCDIIAKLLCHICLNNQIDLSLSKKKFQQDYRESLLIKHYCYDFICVTFFPPTA